MNHYITAQIFNMKAMVKTFEQSCKMTVMQSDGKLDKQEEKQIRKISDSCQRFIRELEGVK